VRCAAELVTTLPERTTHRIMARTRARIEAHARRRWRRILRARTLNAREPPRA
jgi:hypothetical protein